MQQINSDLSYQRFSTPVPILPAINAANKRSFLPEIQYSSFDFACHQCSNQIPLTCYRCSDPSLSAIDTAIQFPLSAIYAAIQFRLLSMKRSNSTFLPSMQRSNSAYYQRRNPISLTCYRCSDPSLPAIDTAIQIDSACHRCSDSIQPAINAAKHIGHKKSIMCVPSFIISA